MLLIYYPFYKYIYIYMRVYLYLNDLRERKLFNTTCIFIDDIHLFIYLYVLKVTLYT